MISQEVNFYILLFIYSADSPSVAPENQVIPYKILQTPPSPTPLLIAIKKIDLV